MSVAAELSRAGRVTYVIYLRVRSSRRDFSNGNHK